MPNSTLAMARSSDQGTTTTTTTASAIVSVLAIISVALRFYTRRMIKAGIGADDWWILVGLLLMLGTGSIILYGVKSDPEGGSVINRDSPTFDYAPHVTYLRASFIAAVLYFSVVTAIKISILLMYRRMFPIDSFRLQSLVVGSVVTFWWVTGTIVAIISCLPVNRLWIGPSAGGYCFDFNIFWMAMGAVELIIDSLILVLPVRMVLGLRLSRQQKVLLVGIFLLGGFVIVTGLLRVILGYRPGSQNVAFSKAELWSAVHIGIAIVCACLPTLRPLVTKATIKAASIKRLYGSTSTSGPENSGGFEYGMSNTVSKNRGGVDALALESVRSRDEYDDRHADTRRLTRTSREVEIARSAELIAPEAVAVRSGGAGIPYGGHLV